MLTSSLSSLSATLALALHANALIARMSSIGVGKRADMTLASKLLGGAVPSCTWVSSGQPAHVRVEEETHHLSDTL